MHNLLCVLWMVKTLLTVDLRRLRRNRMQGFCRELKNESRRKGTALQVAEDPALYQGTALAVPKDALYSAALAAEVRFSSDGFTRHHRSAVPQGLNRLRKNVLF